MAITFTELYQLCVIILMVISLIVQIYQGKKK